MCVCVCKRECVSERVGGVFITRWGPQVPTSISDSFVGTIGYTPPLTTLKSCRKTKKKKKKKGKRILFGC